jgi:glucan endo-1,3-alpha-glucosidase
MGQIHGTRMYVSAVFFIRTALYSPQWIYRGDDWLLVRRWEYLLAHRSAIDIVQVISWNGKVFFAKGFQGSIIIDIVQDYGESHYLAPVRGAQPNSQAWVDGFPHTPWLALNAYFARAFKEGHMPPIERDKIFLWARPHPKGATAPDHVPRPRDWELVSPPFPHRSLPDGSSATVSIIDGRQVLGDRFRLRSLHRAPCRWR